MLRYLLWRVLAALALLCVVVLAMRLLDGGLARILAHGAPATHVDLARELARETRSASDGRSSFMASAEDLGASVARPLVLLGLGSALLLALSRWHARCRRRYVRLRVEPYRTDRADAAALLAMFEALHARLAERRARRLLSGQPSLALEAHFEPGPRRSAWFAVSCPEGLERLVEAALRAAYPNCRLCPAPPPVALGGVLVRLRKRRAFVAHASSPDRGRREEPPAIDRLLSAMAACSEPCCVQLALTPAPTSLEWLARRRHAERDGSAGGGAQGRGRAGRRTMLAEAELRGGLELVNAPLFFADVRVLAASRAACRRVAAQLCSRAAENRLGERGTPLRHRLLGRYARRLARGEGNVFPSPARELYAPSELAALWQLPSVDYAAVPVSRSGVPVAPAPPGVSRVADGYGMLRDEHGPVTIAVELRKQNVAVPGAVEQGKTSFLIATVAEDLRRERCALIVLDPKGDAADAALSLVAPVRPCTLLDFSHPTCGFNPLAVDAPADVIADYVVAALRNLFSDADIRASSDRFLRNAVIAVLAHDRNATLWDAARLLMVGEDGYAFRRKVASAVRGLPEYKEIAEFFASELSAQLADARGPTTSKLDAPVNKLARLLNSPSIKRILLNDSLRVDFDRIISRQEVLVVKGALGAMGAGNTSVMMQLLVGMLDAALARQQDLVEPSERVAVALKIDEAPLVLNRGFAETMALKRSAGLETVACWQSDAQWLDREVREQLDALFAHRVYFATASARDARSAAALTMPEFADSIRPGLADRGVLGRPDVRLHLPKHHAIASWSSADGRQPAFVAQTLPPRLDRERVVEHARRQQARGGRHLTDLRQPHWDQGAKHNQPGHSPVQPSALPRPAAQSAAAPDPTSPQRPARADSYRELVELDRAQSVRWAPAPSTARPLEPDRGDLEMLALIGAFGHLLSSQLHRCFNPGRAATTTQRRLKRLSDAGLVRRFQFHRSDGGGVPMCYLLSGAGAQLLELHGRTDAAAGERRRSGPQLPRASGSDPGAILRQARHELHVAGYALAFARLLGPRCSALKGGRESVLSPPMRDGQTIGPGELRLPGGCAPHEFMRTLHADRRVEVERFETIRPDAIVVAGGLDVLIELDDRPPRGRAAGKLERYDHFLSGWSLCTSRYGPRGQATPIVLFVCRDRVRARDCALAADAVLSACRAYAGEYPVDWSYPGRESVLFAAERDVHEGSVLAYGVERLPAAVRVKAAHGDPSAAAASPQRRALFAESAPKSAPGVV